MPLTGAGFAKIGGLIRGMNQLISPAAQAELAQRLGATAQKLVADEFRHSKDPYGKAWKPLALRVGKPLLDTGRMRNSVTTQPYGRGFRLTIATQYAGTHQYGATITPKNPGGSLRFKVESRAKGRKTTSRWFFLKKAVIPRRQMIPMSSTGGLGPIWGKAFKDTAKRFVQQKLRGPRG